MLIKRDISLFLLMLIVCPAASGHVPVRGAQQLASTAARWRLRPAPSPSEQQDRRVGVYVTRGGAAGFLSDDADTTYSVINCNGEVLGGARVC